MGERASGWAGSRGARRGARGALLTRASKGMRLLDYCAARDPECLRNFAVPWNGACCALGRWDGGAPDSLCLAEVSWHCALGFSAACCGGQAARGGRGWFRLQRRGAMMSDDDRGHQTRCALWRCWCCCRRAQRPRPACIRSRGCLAMPSKSAQVLPSKEAGLFKQIGAARARRRASPRGARARRDEPRAGGGGGKRCWRSIRVGAVARGR